MNDTYKVGFVEEARELLSELEAALLELEQRQDDPGVIGRAFRALHTIKGSGAMFGFENIAAFAHNLEAVFDRLRKHELDVTPDLIRLTLTAGDQIRSMLDESDSVEEQDRILAELHRLTGSRGQLADAMPPAVGVPAATGPVATWRIHFSPGPDLLFNGTNPLLLLRELREMGTLQVQLDSSAIPPLSELDPERCYVAWDLRLTTAEPYEAIRDIFIFVEDACDLSIDLVQQENAAKADASLASVPRFVTPAGARTNGAANVSSVRITAAKLDELVNLVGELVTVQARLSALAARQDDADLFAVSEEIDRLTSELRENSMSIRMLPLRNTFERFRRLVHDLSTELGKKIRLTIEGADTELDKTVIDQLHDPLIHLIRNSIDHGIEPPDIRRAAGKDPVATIRLSALHSGAQVLIQVSDDGRGLDFHAVRARAIEQGLIDPLAQLSEAEVFGLILTPGFSTAREVTDISGRGVGMDVVRRNVEGLRGSLEVASKPGAGVTVTLRLPLTLAIIDGLLVRVGEAHFVLPLASSLECIELTARDIEDAHGNHLANVRGQTIPYIRLSEYFDMERPRPPLEHIMVVETDEGQFGLVIDEVLGNHQTVIKNLGRLYRDVQVVSGATILGNGTVALILDPHRLVQAALRAAARAGRTGQPSVGERN